MRRLILLLTLVCGAFAWPADVQAYAVSTAQPTQTLQSDRLAAAAEGFLRQSLDEVVQSGRYELECVHVPRPMEIPLGAVSFQVQTSGGLRFWGNTCAEVTIYIDGEKYRTIRCYYRVKLYADIVVAARPIQPEKPLTAADLRLEEREVGTKGDRYYTRIDELLGSVVSRPVNMGHALERVMVKSQVILQPGTLVTIVANVNGVEVKMEGTAMQPGREGAIIRVRNNSSRKFVRARVINGTTVEVV